AKTFANRGMSLEEDLNITNLYYRNEELAFIYKKPTPIKVVKMQYLLKKSIIKEGYFEMPSTTDYNGLYNGKYIDFDAKETNSKTSFPLSNIHIHQINHLKNICKHKGIGFIIVRFNLLNMTYLLLGEQLFSFIDNYKRASIPLAYFKEYGYLIPYNYLKRCDYLKVIKDLEGIKYEKENK
ncbi:MAG: Holliday junction resolvase RecU, partial [Bacilli bacterium]